MDDYDPDDPLAGATKCPHCGGLAKTTPHPELRHVCNICGAPRIPHTAGELSTSKSPQLMHARAALRSRSAWRAAGVVGGIGSTVGGGLAALLALIFSSAWAWGVPLLLTLPFVLLLIIGFTNSKRKSGELAKHVDDAWRMAARELILRTGRGMTAPQIADKLGVDLREADEIIAELSVDNMLTSDITSEGQIELEPLASVRIDAGADGVSNTIVSDELDARFAALEEAMAEQEAAEAEAGEIQDKTTASKT